MEENEDCTTPKETEGKSETPEVETHNESQPVKPPRCASFKTAKSRIERSLAKNGVEHRESSVDDALFIVYEARDEQGIMPTREAFAEACSEQAVGEQVRGMADPFKAVNPAVPAVAVVAAVVIAGAAVAYGLSGNGSEGQPAQDQQSQQEVAATETQEEYVLDIGVLAEGWDAATSSKVIVHVEGNGVDFYHAFDANDAGALIAVPQAGDYTISFISPINADGSIYRVPDKATVTAKIAGSAASSSPSHQFTKVDAKDVTADDINKIVDQVTEAVKKGDDTLTGENGVKVVEKVTENAKANGNVDAGAIDQKANEAETEAKSGTTQATGTVPSGATGSNASGSNSNNGGNAAGSGNSGGTQQAHTHNWVAQTKTVHHDAQYKTVHHDAVKKNVIVCNSCGATFTSQSAASAHKEETALAGDYSHSSTNKSIVVQAAYDEQVLVKAAYDEQVLVKGAYDETVTTGYKCSTCGATK